MSTPASVNLVSGAPKSAPINTQFAAPLVVQVLDANGNPVSGVTVNFYAKGRDASVSFSGGVSSAVTNGSGNASVQVIANGVKGASAVEAWIGAIGPGAIGPAIFWLSNTGNAPISNIAAIQAAWTTAKAQLATVQADAATLAADLLTMEASITALANLGATDISEWLRTNVRQTRLGYVPFVSPIAGASVEMFKVFAVQPGTVRDLTSVDQRPISSTNTGALA